MIRAQLSMMGVVCILALSPTGWADSSKAETVLLVATEYGFAPNRLTFRVGTAYRLRFENRGKELHEFTAPAFLKTGEIANPEALNPEGTEIVLQPGEAKDLYFVPKQAGRFPFVCADHDWAGMTGEIVVE
jgi:plastocyanin